VSEKKISGSILIYGFAFFLIIMQFILPKQGKYVLWNEGCRNLIICLAVLYIAWKISTSESVKNHNLKKSIKVLVVCVSISMCVLATQNIVKDLVGGKITITLNNIGLVNYQGLKGKLTQHYYVTGVDAEGISRRLEISSNEYAQLSLECQTKITVDIYPYTERVISIKGE
jgi:hypothetical protein